MPLMHLGIFLNLSSMVWHLPQRGIFHPAVEEAVNGPAHALEQEDQEISPVSQFYYFPLVLAQNITCLCNFFMPHNSDLHRMTVSHVTACGWAHGWPSVGTTPHSIIPHPCGLWGGWETFFLPSLTHH